MRQTRLLGALIEDRPLIVLGYSGRDDFDILPGTLQSELHRLTLSSKDDLWYAGGGAFEDDTSRYRR